MLQLPHAHLFYEAHQPEAAQHSLLLLHGAGGSHLSWPAELRHLPQTAVYTLDLAGHGRSAPPGRSSIEAYTQDVLDFIEALALKKVIVMGHSMGGAIAQMAGLAQQPAVVGLVLVATGAKLRVSPTLLAALQDTPEGAVDMLNESYWSNDQIGHIKATYRQQMLACPADVTLNDFLACDQFDVRDRLAQIALPTLVISGENDRMTPPRFGQFLADHIPQADFALIERAEHMLTLEFPQQLAQLVGDFVLNLSQQKK